MFPTPNKIIGSREDLIKSYIEQVNSLHTTTFSTKQVNTFRFCSYNVKYFKFENYTCENIKSFIDIINPDAFSLIEYDIKHDYIFKGIKDYNTVLFEQLPGYGIFSSHNNSKYILHNIDQKNLLSHGRYGNMNELRGFTHITINLNKTFLNIFTVHLDVWDESGSIRLQEITELVDYIINKSLTNVLILGDFNEWDLKNTDNTYGASLVDFKRRTGLKHFSTQSHDFLKQNNFVNVFHLKEKYPKFSCWSGKLVDFCYLFKSTWSDTIEIADITMPFLPYSDHLPIVIDIKYK